MKCLADYDVEVDICLEKPETFSSSLGSESQFEFHIKNKAQEGDKEGSLVSIKIVFEVDQIEDAADISRAILADIINSLAFVTNGRFSPYRLTKIIDWTPGLTSRTLLFFTEPAADAPAIAAIGDEILTFTQELIQLDLSNPLKSAMRWFRLGVAAEVLEEQFQYFWFALEILAQIDKPNDKVPDRCAKCRGALFCSACNEHPKHRAFSTQLIEKLVSDISGDTQGETYGIFVRVRNTLMHGNQLHEIESELPCEAYEVVDKLAGIVWKVICFNVNKKWPVSGRPFLLPSTYVKHLVMAATNMTITLPEGPNGLDIHSCDELGIEASVVRFS
ncbi:hypothetical protein GTP45_05265 [Pseudoduganella sp. FT55W]|uniref:Apea-like HEPN domain-containing protein n=1 Tax=Duganella rivi TaxID=2666083 RepID=A0A7X4GNE5_9BURK|nr:methylamine utilization protein MauJ [Duganella rivi]MYM66244.1 hypothetical protein [Duganella rivi]